MARQIKIIIVDDIQETIESIKQLATLQEDLAVIGEARSAEEMFTLVPAISPDVVLMDINMKGIDGIRATEILREKHPELVVILMSVQQEPEYFRKAMLAGAHNYLIKPFSSHDLVSTIKETFERQRRLQMPLPQGKVIAVFSPKGGVGKTTLAVNLAVELKKRHIDREVALVDGVLTFGDVALFINLQPRWTLYDAANEGRSAVDLWSEKLLLVGPVEVLVLPAPALPEQAETVSTEVLLAAIRALKSKAAYTVVDLDTSFNDHALAVMDLADLILVVGTPDLPAVKNVRLALDTLEKIGINKEKTRVVLNRVNSEGSMDMAMVLHTINHPVVAELPSDGKTVMHALNKGVPFVLERPAAAISSAIRRLAELIDADNEVKQTPAIAKSGWRRFLGGE